MLVEIYIVFQVIAFVLFFVAFFTKQEIIWGIVLILSGILMGTSYTIETYTYQFNQTLGAYVPYMELHYYPYLSGINILLFGLSILFMMFDIFSKYGVKLKGG